MTFTGVLLVGAFDLPSPGAPADPSRRGSSLSPRQSQRRAARSHPSPPSHARTSPPLPYMLRLNTSETSAVIPFPQLEGLAREVTGGVTARHAYPPVQFHHYLCRRWTRRRKS